MPRSPITLIALFLAASALGWSQAGPPPAEPKPGSGQPQASTSSAQSNGSLPQQPAQAPAPDAASPAAPTSSPASSSEEPLVAQPSPAGQQKRASQKSAPAEQQNVVLPPPPPAEPKTEILDTSATSGALATDGHDPILDPAPVPATTTTLVGGTISGIDRLRNRLTVKVFGGGNWTVNFDERTRIFHNGRETTQLALKKGERVYVDTQLDNNQHDIFARNIRVGVAVPPADADGQIVDVDFKHNELTLRDTINSVPVRFAVDQDTRISSGQTPAAFKDVIPGALVHVRFAAESPNRGLAREIHILAAPGATFTFAGTITYLDMHRGLLALQNLTDDKNYEIRFAANRLPEIKRMVVGTEVRIVATFEGARYTAESITITKGFQPLEKK